MTSHYLQYAAMAGHLFALIPQREIAYYKKKNGIKGGNNVNVKTAVKDLRALRKKQQSLMEFQKSFTFEGLDEQMNDINNQISLLIVSIIGASAQAIRHDVDVDILTDVFAVGLSNMAAAEHNGVTYRYVSRLVSRAYQIDLDNGDDCNESK